VLEAIFAIERLEGAVSIHVPGLAVAFLAVLLVVVGALLGWYIRGPCDCEELWEYFGGDDDPGEPVPKPVPIRRVA
jgi:hypothetical protein